MPRKNSMKSVLPMNTFCSFEVFLSILMLETCTTIVVAFKKSVPQNYIFVCFKRFKMRENLLNLNCVLQNDSFLLSSMSGAKTGISDVPGYFNKPNIMIKCTYSVLKYVLNDS